MRIVLLGPPGSGKGTQGQLMAERYGVPQISTGDLLRAAASAETPLGKRAKTVMDSGQLMSDELVMGIIEDRLGQSDASNGFILDGFPRNAMQAQALEELLARLRKPLQLALLIEVNVDNLLQRLAGRRTCNSCGRVYNIYTSPPKMDDRCDECGGKLRHRADDAEETISNRLRVYESQTLPVVEYYHNLQRLRRVQGIGEIKDIFKAVVKVCDAVKKEADKAAAEQASKAKTAAERTNKIKKAAEKQAAKRTQEKKTAASKKKPAKKAPVKKKATKKKVSKKKVAKKKAVAKSKAGKKKAAIKKKPTKKKSATKRRVTTKKKVGRNKVSGKKVLARKKTAKKKTAKKKVRAAPKKKVIKKGKKKAAIKKKSSAKRRRR